MLQLLDVVVDTAVFPAPIKQVSAADKAMGGVVFVKACRIKRLLEQRIVTVDIGNDE
jgi:hypothetical protein